jgi:integrase
VRRTKGQDHLFGRADNGFSGWSKSKGMLDAVAKLKTPWTLHDLRRTALTRLEALEVPVMVLGHIANHRTTTRAGFTSKVYAKYDYAKEKREALDIWAAQVKAAIAKGQGDNVVKLRA